MISFVICNIVIHNIHVRNGSEKQNNVRHTESDSKRLRRKIYSLLIESRFIISRN